MKGACICKYCRTLFYCCGICYNISSKFIPVTHTSSRLNSIAVSRILCPFNFLELDPEDVYFMNHTLNMSKYSGFAISSDSDVEEEVIQSRESRKHIVYQSEILDLYKQVKYMNMNLPKLCIL